MNGLEESGSPKVVNMPMPNPPSPNPSNSPEFGHALALENHDVASGTESEGSPISTASSFSLPEDDFDHKLPGSGEKPQFRGRRNEAVMDCKDLAARAQGVVVVEQPVLLEHEAGEEIIAHEVVPPHPPVADPE